LQVEAEENDEAKLSSNKAKRRRDIKPPYHCAQRYAQQEGG
jgi:hypothetical protein